MTWAVYINETPLSDLGIYVTGFGDSWLSAPRREYPTIAIPGRSGAILVADPVTAPRVLSIEAAVSTAARTIASRRTAEDQLKSLAYRALVKVVVDDDVTAPRQIDAVCTGCTITPYGHPVDATVSRCTLSLLCPDPTWADVVGQIIGFTATASAVPLGTAPSGGIIRIAVPNWSANVTDPTVSYLSAAGVSRGSLTFTALTLGAGTDYLEVNLDQSTATRYTSGSAIDVIDLLSSGDFFALDPMDGDVLNSSYPQLKVTSTAGTPSGTYLGTRRWL